MPTTFGKLNLKDHKEILVLNAPDTFEKEIRGSVTCACFVALKT
jgi:hypothetical protein